MLLCLAGRPLHAEQADDSPFFQVRGLHTYNAIFGLPVVASRLVQTHETQVSLEHSNQFSGGVRDDETLQLDGESSELVIRNRLRLASCWQLESQLPLIAHSGGRFDRAIDDWHQFFNLPDASRDTVDFGQISYIYRNDQGSNPSVTRAQSGIGDVQISLQRALNCFATADTTGAEHQIRLGLKLPTGNPHELRGSGRADLYADWQSPVWQIDSGQWLYGASLGMLLIGQSESLVSQRGIALYGSVGLQWRYSQRLRLIAQLDWHTPLYDSHLQELGANALGMHAGLRLLLSRQQSIELSVSEDISVDTFPDIVVRLAWTLRPGQ